MRRSSATTLQDVAREAGVATMTVSVVLNGARSGTRVSDATRQRILEAAARLRYRPNAVARGLTRQRMDTIGVVAKFDDGEINLYFLEVLTGILDAGVRYGQNTMVFSVSDWEKDEQRILRLCDGRVDGMILVGPIFSADFAETLLHYSAFVTIHSTGAMPNTYDLNVDDEAAACTIVRHLVENGHRRIAHFTGGNLEGAQRRLNGYRKALTEAGIPLDDSLVLDGEFSTESGHRLVRALVEGWPNEPLPTAIFCANDAVAYGCIEELTRYGISVPDDVSVAGFDDLMTARMTNPPLTTMRQPFHRMGQRAVELVLQQIQRDSEDAERQRLEAKQGEAADSDTAAKNTDTTLFKPHKELFDTELIVRKSVAPPSTVPVRPKLP
jgi:LacI family transcriptional regulator